MAKVYYYSVARIDTLVLKTGASGMTFVFARNIFSVNTCNFDGHIGIDESLFIDRTIFQDLNPIFLENYT